ncbi:hypothetical protein [Candidatus Mycoplasma haematohominis]|uniref:hypothetical protein n=1 Tax=Candidatus Mycoplasma haematohominis TaxID=1494318 RepID=UPI001C0A687F|nr:hypothetical protein [Candidatus Mycoplasma haemohominis]
MRIDKSHLSFPVSGYSVFLIDKDQYRVVKVNDDLLSSEYIEEEHFLDSGSYSVDLKTLSLAVNGELRQDVVWFQVIEDKADKYEVKRRAIGFIDYVLSILTLGIYGLILLKRSNNFNFETTSNLQDAQEKCCRLSLIEDVVGVSDLFEDSSEVSVAKNLRDDYDGFSSIQQKISELEGRQKRLGSEEEVEVFVELKDEFGDIQEIKDQVNEYRNIRNSLGSSQSIEDAIRLKRNYGGFEVVERKISDLENKKNELLMQRAKLNLDEEFDVALSLIRKYGNFSSINSRLERSDLGAPVGGLEENSEYRRLRDVFNKFGSDEEIQEAIEFRRRHGSFEKIENEINDLKKNNFELSNQAQKLLGSDEFEQVIELRDTYGSWKKLKERVNDLEGDSQLWQQVEHKWDSLDELNDWTLIKNKFRNAQALEEQIRELENYKSLISLGDLGEVNSLRNEFGSFEQIRSKIHSLSVLKEELTNKLAVIGNQDEIQRAIELKQQHGSFNTILEKLEGVQELQKLRLENQQFRDKDEEIKKQITDLQVRNSQLDANNRQLLGQEDFDSVVALRNSYGNWNKLKEEISSLSEKNRWFEEKQRQLGSDKDLEEAAELKERFGSFQKIQDDLEGVDSLKNEFGNFEQIRNKIHYLDSDTKSLREQLTVIGNQDEIQRAIELKQQHGSFETMSNKLQKIQDLEQLRLENNQLREKNQELEEWVPIRNRYGSAGVVVDEIRELENYKSSISFGDLEKVNSLRNEFGGFDQIRNKLNSLEVESNNLSRQLISIGNQDEIAAAVQLKQQYGSFHNMSEKLQGINELEHLRLENKELRDKDKQWENLANNKTLEQVLKMRLEQENENKTAKGKDLELEIENVLADLSNNGAVDILWEAQHYIPNTKEKADFLIEFKGNKGNTFRVVVESKRKEEVDSLQELSGVDSQITPEDWKKWMNQLCSYYTKAEKSIQLGLLVTNAHEVEKIGFRKIGFKDLDSKYSSQDMNLLLVHISVFKQLITLIRVLNNVYEPDVEWTFEKQEAFYSDPDMRKSYEKLIAFFKHCNKNFNSAVNASKECSKKASSVEKNLKKYLEYFDEVQKDFEKVLDNAEYYMDKPLLEGTVPLEEEMIVGEDEE